MQLAADLHLHSRYAGGVSPSMTVENIARVAQRKGIDLLGTGDGLQSEWLDEIEAAAEPAPGEPDVLQLKSEIKARVNATLPMRLRRHLRYVVSAEVNCAPNGTPELGGLHHLLYFPSINQARGFRSRMLRYGDLREGRPSLNLTSRQLLKMLLEFDTRCKLAPAHVFNPWYSSLGTVAGARTLAALFGDLTPHLLAVETGLTSTPLMCRRVSALDHHTLFSCSDAHSLDNIGRECTLVNLPAPGFDSLMAALHTGAIASTIKFPVARTRYYLNRCGPCQASFDERKCPRCGRTLVGGSRDRLETVADRSMPLMPPNAPPFMELLPLAQVLAEQMNVPLKNPAVRAWEDRLLNALGDERRILTETSEAEIAQAATARLARALIAQRHSPPGSKLETTASNKAQASGGEQLGLAGFA